MVCPIFFNANQPGEGAFYIQLVGMEFSFALDFRPGIAHLRVGFDFLFSRKAKNSVPAFNAARLIKTCVDAIANQVIPCYFQNTK